MEPPELGRASSTPSWTRNTSPAFDKYGRGQSRAAMGDLMRDLGADWDAEEEEGKRALDPLGRPVHTRVAADG